MQSVIKKRLLLPDRLWLFVIFKSTRPAVNIGNNWNAGISFLFTVKTNFTFCYLAAHLVPGTTVGKWHDRNKMVDVPLFQSYIFVHLNNLKDYYEGLKIDGVLNYVRTGKEIAMVHKKVIEDIRLSSR